MSYTDLQSLSVGEIKRLCGVSRETFGEMALGVAPAARAPREAGRTKQTERWGAIANGIRILARIPSASFILQFPWGLHETTVGRIIQKVENILVKCGKFRLPSQRQLYQPGWEWKVFVVDVSEMEIERPKKN